ncbi:MAG: SDR family oxidoreductase [Alphaproteobacteria bacterium]|jgi:NAD(P)-dependent dehydrogenase (short-subunit alcohol dehydrogenase family)|nr:SDR family oxidoreductase [Alphaproteobacteria bacterium]
MNRFAGQTALVAGGAGGIGAAVCRRLALEGARVLVADVRHDEATALAAAIGGEGLGLDAGDEESWADAVRGRSLHVLVNCAAGGTRLGAVDTLSLADWEASYRVTAHGVFLGMKHALGVMGAGGAIVNIASLVAHGRAPQNAAYASAKAAVISMSRSAAVRFAKRGVRVNCVSPGFIRTPPVERMFESLAGGQKTAGDIEKAYTRQIPMGRLGEPEEVADAVAFLASCDARFVTGAELIVDGGMIVG